MVVCCKIKNRVFPTQKHLGIDIISLGAALTVAFPNLTHLSLDISKNDITNRGMSSLVDSICLWSHSDVYLSVVMPMEYHMCSVWYRTGTGGAPVPAISG